VQSSLELILVVTVFNWIIWHCVKVLLLKKVVTEIYVSGTCLMLNGKQKTKLYLTRRTRSSVIWWSASDSPQKPMMKSLDNDTSRPRHTGKHKGDDILYVCQWQLAHNHFHTEQNTVLLARDVIYTSCAYATMSVSVCDGSALAHYS